MLSIQFASNSPPLFLFGVGLLSLLVGSFLNVVIARLPKMLLDEHACEDHPPFNLCFPTSHCPQCLNPIRWFDNIPVLSFLWLKGQCRHCQANISIRYPLVELLTLIFSLGLALRFGFGPSTLTALILVWALIALTFIDLDCTLLPDSLTLPLLWIGLLINTFHIFTTPSEAILGAAIGYLILWSIYWVFKWITNKEGMGYGDFKLLAMLGAWLGWQALPQIILVSSLLGTLVGLRLIFCNGKGINTMIPFGPFLAIGGYCALLFGAEINRLYFVCFAL